MFIIFFQHSNIEPNLYKTVKSVCNKILKHNDRERLQTNCSSASDIIEMFQGFLTLFAGCHLKILQKKY